MVTEHKTGDKIGKFTYVRELEHGVYSNGYRYRRVEIICPYCDKVFATKYYNLIRERVRLYSCGCQRKNQVRERLEKINQYHGHAGKNRSPEYITWANIKHRCYNKTNIRYNAYGGRGITVCDRWRNSFQVFLADMGNKPGPEYSIDRIDVNGNYEPGNCRWVTSDIQFANMRPKEVRIVVNPGDVYGKLTVISEADPYEHEGTKQANLNLKCECGNEFVTRKSHVTTGKVYCCYNCRPKKPRPGRAGNKKSHLGENN
jgi:hypothetical protein